jgi:hypothetical protein
LLKLKLSHSTPRRRLGGEETYMPLILDLSTRWGWVVSVTPRPRSSPGERTPGTHCTGGWVGPRAGLDTEVRGKIISPQPWIERWSPSRTTRSHKIFAIHKIYVLISLNIKYIVLVTDWLTHSAHIKLTVPDLTPCGTEFI